MSHTMDGIYGQAFLYLAANACVVRRAHSVTSQFSVIALLSLIPSLTLAVLSTLVLVTSYESSIDIGQ